MKEEMRAIKWGLRRGMRDRKNEVLECPTMWFFAAGGRWAIMRGDLLFTAVSPTTQSIRITHLQTDRQTADSPPTLINSKFPWRCV